MHEIPRPRTRGSGNSCTIRIALTDTVVNPLQSHFSYHNPWNPSPTQLTHAGEIPFGRAIEPSRRGVAQFNRARNREPGKSTAPVTPTETRSPHRSARSGGIRVQPYAAGQIERHRHPRQPSQYRLATLRHVISVPAMLRACTCHRGRRHRSLELTEKIPTAGQPLDSPCLSSKTGGSWLQIRAAHPIPSAQTTMGA